MSFSKKVIIEGTIKRESSVASGYANERHFALELHSGVIPRLASYRDPADEAPSKSWKITKGTTVGDISKRKFKLRSDSLLTSIAYKTYTVDEMHQLTITFGGLSLPWSSDRLTLCFPGAEEAQKWRDALVSTIDALPDHSSSFRSQVLESGSSDAEMMAAVAFAHDSGAVESSGRPDANSAATTANAAAATPAPREHSSRSWQSVRHVNGVAVYAEQGGPEGGNGAVMASSVVRAPPRECFLALMRSTTSQADSGDLPFSDSMAVLETIDPHTHVVRHCWSPTSALARLICAPREMVALRTWRREDDGTYIVLYQSISHRKARETGRGWLPSWTTPVRARVEAAGFTVSPLLPEYCPGGGASQECLVTLVIKADLAGGLGTGSWASWVAPAAVDATRWTLLEPLLMSVVRLRDRVEQSRFTVMPYTMAVEDGGAAPGLEFGAVEAEAEAPGSPLVQRTPSITFQRTTTALTMDVKVHPVTKKEELEGVDEQPQRRKGPAAGAGTGAATAAAAAAAAVPVAPTDASATSPADTSAWAVSGTTERRFWSYPGTSNLRIRGKNYLEDRVKIPAAAPMFDLHSSDLVDYDEPLWHIAQGLPSVQSCPAPFAFVLNLMYPTPITPLQSLVSVWTAPVDPQTESLEALVERWGDDPEGTARAFFTALKVWLEGDGPEADRRRSTKFKLIPRVVKGSWVVRQSVGTTPVLLGQKLKTRYYRGRTAQGCSYFEVDVDISSNSVANSVTRLVVNSITSLVVDLAPLIEGHTVEELPERLLGSIRYEHLDLSTATAWDDEAGVPVKKEA